MSTEHTYHYTAADIRRYLSGSMTAQEMHSLEKTALNDPMLADAIDGYRNAHLDTTKKHLNEINALLQNTELKAHVVSFKQEVSKKQWRRWIAAASVFGILAFSAWFFINQTAKNEAQIAQAATEKQEIISEKNENNKTAPASIGQEQAETKETSEIGEKKSTALKTTAKTEKPKVELSKEIAASEAPLNKPQATMMSDQKAVASQPVAQNSRMLRTAASHADTTAIVVQKGDTSIENEVVVVGFGKQKKEVAGVISKSEAETKTPNSVPIPIGGWNRFYENIYKTLKVNPQKATKLLQIKFDIENATPVRFEVLQSPDSNISSKVIRLIKSGPKWENYQAVPKAEVKLKVE